MAEDLTKKVRLVLRVKFSQSKRAAGQLAEMTGIGREKLMEFARGGELGEGEFNKILEVLRESEGA